MKVDNHESFYPAELHVFQNSKSTILMRMFTEEYIFNNLLRGEPVQQDIVTLNSLA